MGGRRIVGGDEISIGLAQSIECVGHYFRRTSSQILHRRLPSRLCFPVFAIPLYYSILLVSGDVFSSRQI